MARIRSVSPELRQSETVAAWPREARYAWVLLWGYLDDYGRGLDNPRIVAADCFPLDDDVTADVAAEWLELFEKAGCICRYEYDGKRWMHATKWAHWQKPQHPGKVRIPPCPIHEAEANALFALAAHAELTKVSGKSHEDLVRVSPTSKEEEGEKELRRRGSALTRCPSHVNHPSPPPCGRCKELRLAAEQASRTLSLVPDGPLCATHPGERANNCRGCAADRKAAR